MQTMALRVMSLRSTLAFATFALSLAATGLAAEEGKPIYLDQGPAWTDSERDDFYWRDQGSRLIPLRWLATLRRPDGALFLADRLAKYGYLSQEGQDDPALPIGFTVASGDGGEVVGMTCAACHTREISFNGAAYRIDGGPAFADFQSFLSDLDAAMSAVAWNDKTFGQFGAAVLGSTATPSQLAALRQEVRDWQLPFHTMMTKALPQSSPWGVGRLDAVSMIFDRLSGLDIGSSANHIIAANIKPADAPVRYPFLWNAWRQDKTQWPGFAENGNSILGLARNLGEVTGVFSTFHPSKSNRHLLGIDYIGNNSANFRGLDQLEKHVQRIGPPAWPWAIDSALKDKGEAIFGATCAHNCHEIKDGAIRIPPGVAPTWFTPVLNVGTDTREWSILERKVDPGILLGAHILSFIEPMKNPEEPKNVLGLTVVGAILQHKLPLLPLINVPENFTEANALFPPETNALRGAFIPKESLPVRGSYEARVLQGIWAAAPYLHNGSVPTLADLLKPWSERPSSFPVGPAYDIERIGLATEQGANAPIRMTTGCEQLESGNSRCGHEYGTTLSDEDKRALLEYLKAL
jgi:hypothetical protein